MPGRWWVIEESETAEPADPAVERLADYLEGWKLARPTPTPVPKPTPTPTQTPALTCDVATKVVVDQVLGTMNDPLELRADIDVAVRNTCGIPAIVILVGVVSGQDGEILGRQEHYIPVRLGPVEIIAVSILVLGDYRMAAELGYKVEVSPAGADD